MKLKAFLINAACILTAVLNFYSCSENQKEKSPTSKDTVVSRTKISSAGEKEHSVDLEVEYYSPRNIYKIEKEDLNGDGNREIIVLSVFKDTTDRYTGYYNFDMMEIFALNDAKTKYDKIFSDTVDYSSDCSFESLENNELKQILISTNSGGNDEVMSKGMFIFGMGRDRKVNLINYFDSGKPEIADLKNNKLKQILVTDEYGGVMPQSDVIYFVKDIYKMENEKLVNVNGEFGEYFDKKIKETKENYYGLKRKVEAGMQPVNLSYPLYKEALEVILNYTAKGDIDGLRKFWNEEKNSLERNIPQDEFSDMSNFIFKVIPNSKNA